jgi:hypothetical protein
MSTPNHDSSVTPLRPIEVNADNFVIKQYKVKGKPAQVLIAATLEGQQPEKVLDDMLQIGAIASQQSHGESMVRQIESSMENLAKAINIEATEKFPEQIKSKTDDLMKDLAKYLDPKMVGSIQQQIDKVLTAQMTEQTAILQKELKGHYAKLEEGLNGLNKVKEVVQNSSHKGIPFQEVVGGFLDRFAGTDDMVSDLSASSTGKAAREGKGKSGDYLVTVSNTFGTPAPIAFSVEAKASKKSESEALKELNANMKNRGVDVGVIVFESEEDAPTMGKRLKVFPGNRIMVILDESEIALQCAYILAKQMALSSKKAGGDSIDPADVERLVNEVSEHLNFDGVLNKEARAIELALDRLIKGASDARDRALKALSRFQRD